MSLARKDLKAIFQDFDDQGYMLRRIMAKGRNPHVCVVGAGMAGLRCAQVLAERGFRVTILEARDRTGGRVGSPRSDMCRILNCTFRCTKVIDRDTFLTSAQSNVKFQSMLRVCC